MSPEHLIQHLKQFFAGDEPWVNTPGPTLCIETHLSLVFIRGDRVLKVAKPVDIGVADYREQGARRAALTEEYRLNNLWAPELYTGLAAVHVGGVISWYSDALNAPQDAEIVLVMQRFDATLEQLAQQGKLTCAMAEQLARRLGEYYRMAEQVTGYWTADKVDHFVEESLHKVATLAGHQLQPYPQLAGQYQAEIAFHKALIDARAQTQVKLVHGDIHLGNAALLGDKVLPFDGIAFNDELNHTCTAADIAWLLADLVYRGHADWANRVLNIYLEETGDYAALPLLPLYTGYRAFVRAKVAAIRLSQLAQNDENRSALEAECARWLQIADACTVNFAHKGRRTGAVIAVGGLSGSGKSTVSAGLAAQLATLPGNLFTVVVRNDVVRKHMWGCTPRQHLPAEAYSAEAHRKTYAFLMQTVLDAALQGAMVLADATHIHPQGRTQLEESVRGAGLHFYGIWCSVPEKVARQRITQRAEAKNDASDATTAVLDAQLKEYDDTQQTWAVLDTSGTPEHNIAQALKLI